MIFGIGFPRTGTRSLADALAELGFRTSHEWNGIGPGWRAVLGDEPPRIDFKCEAIIGFCSFCYPCLDRRHPGSKFILTVRDEIDWLGSTKGNTEWASGDAGTTFRQRIFEFSGHDEWRLRQAWLEHYVEVQRYFAGRRDQLLIMDIPAGDGWDQLCPFLGVEPPERTFPHLHKSRYATASGRRVAQPGSAPGLGQEVAGSNPATPTNEGP